MLQCGGCYGSLVDRVCRPIVAPDDNEETIAKKRTWVSVAVITAPIFLVSIVLYLQLSLTSTASDFAGFAASTGVYVGWYFYPKVSMEIPGLWGFLASVLLADVNGVGRGARRWSWAVIVMDAALVLNIPMKHTVAMVCATVVYLVAVVVDRATAGVHEGLGSGDPWICDCADPPCREPFESAAWAICAVTFVFVCDFHLTRGFAAAMRQQIQVVQQAIDVTAAIAHLLSMYEVEEGRALLEGEDSDKLPAELKGALLRLLNNLNEYKPYLPDAMLVREGSELSTAEPPGLGQEEPKVTMVFTDIQSSTELWEKHPQGMYTGLQEHNIALRSVLHDCAGYEVKVIGDAFMTAFKTAEDGCRFALDAQVALTEAKWPSDLLQHPLCKPAQGQSGRMLWCGPRVRIGVHCGAVRVEKNPVTGRCDYFGPAVNTAARVEACLRHGGLTGVTKAVMDELTPDAMERLGHPVVARLGQRELRGVVEPVDITLLFAEHLAEREAVLSTQPADPQRLRQPRRLSSSLVSVGSSSTEAPSPSVRSPIGSFLQKGLSRRLATAATFRAVITELAEVAEMLEVVEHGADMTQGVVAGAMSLQCVVVWNGPRACSDHCGQCLRATDFVRRWRPDRAAAGASSGELLHGTISAGRRKHAAVIGGCVELSAALAEGAEQSGEALLAAGTFGRYCSTQNRTRRHAHWGVHGSSDTVELWAVVERGGSVDVMSLEGVAAADHDPDRPASAGMSPTASADAELPYRVVVLGSVVS